jgi:cyclopropane-fatty-acyl-phospholipid synthase
MEQIERHTHFLQSGSRPAAFTISSGLERRLRLLSRALPAASGFELRLPDGNEVRLGGGDVAFRIHAATPHAMKALASFDELQISEAYMDGDLDIQGDLLAALSLRKVLKDRHPFFRLLTTRILPLLRGQTASDRKGIEQHYDEDPEFFLSFLDRGFRCYSHGFFSSPDDSLETAIRRKLDTAMASCRVRPGDHVLDIGAGWGAFTEFAGLRGVRVTSLTISRVSERFVSELIARRGLPCRVEYAHFLEYTAPEPYDAIVNLGVTEHLPDYPATMRQYERLLKPGGRVYLDASASRSAPSTVTAKHLYPGNGKNMRLAEYLQAVEKSLFDVILLGNDTPDYARTIECWARNLDNSRDRVIERFGTRQYRRFRLYLWACLSNFLTRDLEAYHMVLQRHA